MMLIASGAITFKSTGCTSINYAPEKKHDTGSYWLKRLVPMTANFMSVFVRETYSKYGGVIENHEFWKVYKHTKQYQDTVGKVRNSIYLDSSI